MASRKSRHHRPFTLAVDVGGSGIKAMVLDAAGARVTDRARIDTPHPAKPGPVLDVIRRLADEAGPFDRATVGFPGVVRKGVTETAVNMHPSWMHFDLARALERILGVPVHVANDADIQGYGVIKGRGVELTITLGTGVGAGLFVDGTLVPNLELGHHPFRRGETYEEQLGNAALKKVGARRWNRRLAKAIPLLEFIFNYDALYLGGGNARKITITLPKRVHVVSNDAGLTGGIALWRQGATSTSSSGATGAGTRRSASAARRR
ncbi:MAG: ROK family protein [Vicinamibacterales bacterium]